MGDVWEIYEQVKKDYHEKLEEAYARGLMTDEEYERGKKKAHIRITQEVGRILQEKARESMGG